MVKKNHAHFAASASAATRAAVARDISTSLTSTGLDMVERIYLPLICADQCIDEIIGTKKSEGLGIKARAQLKGSVGVNDIERARYFSS
jgi:hypothetical protein